MVSHTRDLLSPARTTLLFRDKTRLNALKILMNESEYLIFFHKWPLKIQSNKEAQSSMLMRRNSGAGLSKRGATALVEGRRGAEQVWSDHSKISAYSGIFSAGVERPLRTLGLCSSALEGRSIAMETAPALLLLPISTFA